MANDPIKKGPSFWAKPEGTTGMIVGAGILGILGYGAYKVMPMVENLMENGFYAALFGCGLLALLYVFVLDSRMRDALWLKYTLAMQKVTYSIIKDDPFGVLRETQKVAKRQTAEAAEQCTQVKSQVTVIKRTLDTFRENQAKIRDEANWMKQHGKSQDEIANHVMKLGKLDESITRLTASYTMISGLYDQLIRAKHAFEVIDSNIDWEIDMREEEYVAMTATNNAVSIFRRALSGNDKNAQLRSQAMAFVVQDYSEKLGRVSNFMEDAASFLENADMQNAMYADKGLKLLEDLNSRDLNVGLLQAPAKDLSKMEYFSTKK